MVYFLYYWYNYLIAPFDRLETLGHTIALLLKNNAIQEASSTRTNSAGVVPTEYNGNYRPLVAMIVPATSKGISPDNILQMSFFNSFLSSLYTTRSRLF
jgi:hypothetical protein